MSSSRRRQLQLSLKAEERIDFAQPRGVLVRGDLSPFISGRSWTKVICVGDVVAGYCIKSGRPPDVVIVDGKTKRQQPAELDVEAKALGYDVIRIVNPPGGVTPEAIEHLCKILKESGRQLLLIEGEEDMLALPALMCAPVGSLVIYGIPDRGASLVVINRDVSREAQTRLLRLLVMSSSPS